MDPGHERVAEALAAATTTDAFAVDFAALVARRSSGEALAGTAKKGVTSRGSHKARLPFEKCMVRIVRRVMADESVTAAFEGPATAGRWVCERHVVCFIRNQVVADSSRSAQGAHAQETWRVVKVSVGAGAGVGV